MKKTRMKQKATSTGRPKADLWKWTTKGGKKIKVPVKPSEAKAFIMKVNGWTAEEYRKKYDIFKNKLTAYESYREARGNPMKKQSYVQVLYSQAKAKYYAEQAGEKYVPSYEMQRIEGFSAVSITKGRKYAKQAGTSPYIERANARYEKTASQIWGQLLKSSPKAREIWNKIDDPVKREKALKAYADALHAKQDDKGEIKEGEAFRYGEKVGSDIEFEFDYSAYM